MTHLLTLGGEVEKMGICHTFCSHFLSSLSVAKAPSLTQGEGVRGSINTETCQQNMKCMKIAAVITHTQHVVIKTMCACASFMKRCQSDIITLVD